jgi:beta-glucosidase
MSDRLDSKSSGALPGLGVLLLQLLIVPGVVSADEAIFLNGAPTEGNVLLVGDKKQWDTPVGQEPVTSASGFLTVEPEPEEKALGAEWNGEGEAQLFLAHARPRDYSAALAENAALVTVLRLKKAPTKKVLIKMGCGYPCASSADITRLLEALTPDQWVRLSFDLKCFSDGGLAVGRVDTPFLITTPGAMSLSIADISLVPGLGPDATIRCRK